MAYPFSKKNFRLPLALATAAMAAQATRSVAQTVYADQLEVPDLTLPQVRYLKMDLEDEQDKYTSKQANTASLNNSRLYLAPGVGIGWDYFLYHPDLLAFSLLAEPGYNLQQYSGNGTSSSNDALLLNGTLTGQLLREKDYATTLNYTRTHDDYHYDYFNSATVDTQGWGASSGYRTGPVPVSVSVSQTHTDTQGATQDTVMDQTTVNLHARNERKDLDATDLNYQFSQLNYNTAYQLSSYANDNTYNRVALTDAEHFQKSTLTSTLLYYNINSTEQDSSDLNLGLDYHRVLTSTLSAFGNYSLSDYSATGLDSLQNFGTAGLSHQLYESLSSSVNVHASTLNTTGITGNQDSTTIGAGYGESYTKRLGEGMRLSLGNDLNYDLVNQSVSGSEIYIANEGYTVPATGAMQIRLNTGRDVGTPVITKNNIQLAPAEYTVNYSADPWLITFTSGGPNNIQPGDAVAVSYSVQTNPSGSYSVFSDEARISLRFWHERAEVYARYNLTQNQSASQDFVLQDLQEYSVGADVAWHGFMVQGSYTDHHSTLYDYQDMTASESYSTPLTLHSTAGINLSQQWNYYPPGSGTSTNLSQTSTFFNAMLHYEWRPTSHFSWHSEAGVQDQRGLGNNNLFLAGRTYLDWSVGKLDIHLGYEHENQQYTAETRTRDYVFLRLRRNF